MFKAKFPQKPLKQHLEINSPADPQDVLDVKLFLYQKGLYDVPEYGITPYPDEKLFNAIAKYQKKNNLKVDGVMKVNGETQERMRKNNEIEREELPPVIKNIPGTNIPDRSISEQGLEEESYELYWRLIEDFLAKNDHGIVKPIPNPTMDPNITCRLILKTLTLRLNNLQKGDRKVLNADSIFSRFIFDCPSMSRLGRAEI